MCETVTLETTTQICNDKRMIRENKLDHYMDETWEQSLNKYLQ